jgi:formate dehydrogenase maturation protein FdhE
MSTNLIRRWCVETEVKCVWCGEVVVPQLRTIHNDYGNVKERRCPRCNAILAAYLEEEERVLEKVRSFQD